MSRKRILTITLMLLIVSLVAVGSWIAGSTIQSPAEAAARTAPPQPSPILVPIEKRVLTADIVTRGTARFGLPQSISIAPSTLKAAAGVITTLPAQNSPLNEGDVVLTASGRPLFILQGETPAYRDIVPGITGPDVLQLETGLERLGFELGPLDGTYDEQTSNAVAAWYTAAGFQPFGATADQLAHIRALEQELTSILNNMAAADAAVIAAPLTVDAARASAESAKRVALADVALKADTQAKVAANPASTIYSREAANADLSVAQAAIEATRLAGEVQIQAALDGQAAADREAKRLKAIAIRLTADLDIARRKAGMQLPIDEIIFLPLLPVRVEALNVVLGDTASGPIMTVTNNQLVIDASLRLDEAPLVKPGMVIGIDEPDLGLKATGVVGRVAETPGTFGVDGFHIYLEILVDETAVSLVGTSLRLTIPVETTGDAVTVVPVNALSLAADGTSRVQVDNQKTLEFITVQPGLSTDGYVAVTPIDGTLTPGQLVVIGFETK